MLASDVDGNHMVDVDDMNIIINILLDKAPSVAAADVSGDGVVDIDDVNVVVNTMLAK